MASITDGNTLFTNQGLNPLVNFNFMLRVELVFDLPCKSVRAFSRELEYDFIQEGGLNDYVHMRRKPITKPFTLEVERYVGVDYVDPLPLGADLVLPIMLFVSRVPRMFIPGVVARTYVFTGCTVMKKEYGELVGDQSGLLVETTTIGYREMMCVDLPWSEVGDNIFASTPTSPANAATQDKTAQDLKARGQSLYDKALEAKTYATGEFTQAALEERIQQVSYGVEDLKRAVEGELKQRMDEAKKAIETQDQDGKTLAQKAEEAALAAWEKDSAAKKTQEAEDLEKDALDTAEEAREKAKKAVAEAEKSFSGLEEQTVSAAEQEKAREAALKAKELAEEELRQAQTAYDEADKAYKQAKAENDKALQEKKTAEEEAKKAKEAVDSAEKALADAVSAHDQAERMLNSLRNSLTNLEDRKERTQKAVADCTAQHDLCKQANDGLQALPDTPLPPVNTACDKVDRLYRETVFQERQVRETLQHMQAAGDLLKEKEALLGTKEEQTAKE